MTRYGYVYGATIQFGDGTPDHPVRMQRPTSVCWTEKPITTVRLAALLIDRARKQYPCLAEDPVFMQEFWYSELEPVPVRPE